MLNLHFCIWKFKHANQARNFLKAVSPYVPLPVGNKYPVCHNFDVVRHWKLNQRLSEEPDSVIRFDCQRSVVQMYFLYSVFGKLYVILIHSRTEIIDCDDTIFRGCNE